METSLVPTKEDAAKAAADTKLIAMCNLQLLLERVVYQALDPHATFKQSLDAAEFAYKVSGMAAKQAEKAPGTGFSIVIQLPGGASSAGTEITIGGSSLAEPEDDFPTAPSWLTSDETDDL